jgi:hypothetical protein
MLFLLRQIRRKLLSENKITTYLFYGIGEISLVVVGILIAVSIDGWNDDRKTVRQEQSYLERLLSENKQDQATFTSLINDMTKGMESITEFSNALKDDSATTCMTRVQLCLFITFTIL